MQRPTPMLGRTHARRAWSRPTRRVRAGRARLRPRPGWRQVVMSLVSDKLSFVENAGIDQRPDAEPRAHRRRSRCRGAPYETAALQAHGRCAAGSRSRGAPELPRRLGPGVLRRPGRLVRRRTTSSCRRGCRRRSRARRPTCSLLLTKWRGEAAISDGRTQVGSGKLGGLGFYRFARREGQSRDDTEVHGYIAPFVYTRVVADRPARRSGRAHAHHPGGQAVPRHADAGTADQHAAGPAGHQPAGGGAAGAARRLSACHHRAMNDFFRIDADPATGIAELVLAAPSA